MNEIKPKEFILRTKGMSVDYDHAYGVQCVDAIKYFNSLIYGKADFNCGNVNFAFGLYTNYGSNGVEKYFQKKTYKEAVLGDWVVWNYGSKQCPSSHVAMLVEKISKDKVKCWGEGSGKGFSYQEIDTNGIIGVLRPNIYDLEEYLKPRGYFKKGDNGDKIKDICKFFAERKLAGNYYGDYLETVVKLFQKQKGESKVGKPDGCIGQKTLSAMIEDGFEL